LKLALAGDTMLGRGVARALRSQPARSLVADDVASVAREADVFVLNLECCISERGTPWADPAKPFFFRAPPAAVHTLVDLGVDCVTLANNHALDFGEEALLDTIGHLRSAGIAAVGAGPDVEAARAPVVLEQAGFRLGVIGVSDHPAAFASAPGRPGIAYADLRSGVPDWLVRSVTDLAATTDAVLVTPHWGPNMVPGPVAHVRATAARLLEAGATLVAGHSAHVFHGVEDGVLYDLGDFLDDYAVDPVLHNDLGLLFVVTFDGTPRRLEAVPLKLGFCHTRLALGEEADWVRRRFRRACNELGTEVVEADDRLVISFR
jgi:poly-gamma-glutamate capsule biosynthesis protein CapA/YwtB (metallophosphatase superfamily)